MTTFFLASVSCQECALIRSAQVYKTFVLIGETSLCASHNLVLETGPNFIWSLPSILPQRTGAGDAASSSSSTSSSSSSSSSSAVPGAGSYSHESVRRGSPESSNRLEAEMEQHWLGSKTHGQEALLQISTRSHLLLPLSAQYSYGLREPVALLWASSVSVVSPRSAAPREAGDPLHGAQPSAAAACT